MKTTQEQLKRVAPNLYRHGGNGNYYGKCKIGGRIRGPKVMKTAAGADIKDLAMAKRAVRAWIEELEDNAPKGGRVTLGGILDRFQALRANRVKKTQTTEGGIITHIRKHFPKPMSTPVEKVVCSDILLWLTECGHTGRTYDRWRLLIRQVFDLAEADGSVAKNPFKPKLIPTAKKDPVKRPTPTVEEFTAIVDEIRTPTLPKTNLGRRGGQLRLRQPDSADFAAFLGLAGVGQAEASHLEWEHLEAEQIRFVRVKTRAEFYVPYYPWLAPLIDSLRAKAEEEQGTAKLTGRVFKCNDVKHSLSSACRRLNLPQFTQRALRRCLIGRLWKSGVDRKIIAKWQGHRDGGVLITNTYTQVFGSDDKTYEQAQLAKASGKIVKFEAA